MKNNYFKIIVSAFVSMTVLSACHSENDHKTGNHKQNGHSSDRNNRTGHTSGPPTGEHQHGDSSSSNDKSESFTYNFELNGCKTGRHQFNSLEEMCIGLQNDTLNNSCASELRVMHFKTYCPNQTYNPFTESEANNDNPSSLPQSRDEIKGDVLVRTLYAGESSLVLYQNPTGESARTLVFCADTNTSAKKLLVDPDMGGVIITKGTKIIMKNDTSSAFNDGSNLKGTYLQFECK